MEKEDPVEDLRIIPDFEEYANSHVFSNNARLFFAAGAGSRSTPTYNEDAYQKYRLMPRMLRDVQTATLNSKILGAWLGSPVGVAPTAVHALAHPDRELATVAGCVREGCVFVLSNFASSTMEEVAYEAKRIDAHAKFWLQIYPSSDRAHLASLLRKAESLGYSAIVVTVDLPVPGHMKNFFSKELLDEVFKRSCLPQKTRKGEHLTFSDLKWIKENTELPLVAKGILTTEDALQTIQCGVDAIWVSNHGSRLLQKCISPIDVLEEISSAVRDSGVELYVDGGVRSGCDVFVALALGASAVFVGRPAIWGLAAAGETGVRKVLQILKDELLQVMKLSGVSGLEGIDKSLLRKQCTCYKKY